MSLAALLLFACTAGGPEQSAEQDALREAQATELVRARPAAPPVAVDPNAEPVPVILIWDKISSLYRGFFSDADARGALGKALAGRLGAPANVHIRYDKDRFVGQIKLELVEGALLKAPDGQGDTVDLQALAPLTQALAVYRDAIAGRYDLRVASFQIGLESTRGLVACELGVTGTPPPDGSVLSPCVSINGRKTCGEPEAAGVRFPADVARDLRRCLSPR